jgi:hypothetical protein
MFRMREDKPAPRIGAGLQSHPIKGVEDHPALPLANSA